MVSVALFVRLEAKPGKEAAVSKFLRDGLAIVQEEPATTAWFRYPARALDLQESSTPFRMRLGAKHTCQGASGPPRTEAQASDLFSPASCN